MSKELKITITVELDDSIVGKDWTTAGFEAAEEALGGLQRNVESDYKCPQCGWCDKDCVGCQWCGTDVKKEDDEDIGKKQVDAPDYSKMPEE